MLAQARSWPGCRTAAYFRTDTGFEVPMVFHTPQHHSTWGTSASLAGARRVSLALDDGRRPGRTNPQGEPDPSEKEAGMSAAEAGRLAMRGKGLVLGTL
jgi:hypothetical protein